MRAVRGIFVLTKHPYGFVLPARIPTDSLVQQQNSRLRQPALYELRSSVTLRLIDATTGNAVWGTTQSATVVGEEIMGRNGNSTYDYSASDAAATADAIAYAVRKVPRR